MVTAFLIFGSLSLGACVGFVAFALCAIQKDPAASRIPLPDAGGSRAGFSFPGPLALVPPLAGPPRPHSPVASVTAMGRDLNQDYYCADDVAITITDKEVWLEVDRDNLVRVKRIKRLHVDDRRDGMIGAIKSFFRWLGFHTHDWGEWRDAGIVKYRDTDRTIGRTQTRNCRTCGKMQAHSVTMV